LKSESELIDGCRQHIQADQEALYQRFFALGMSVALRYAPSREDALEILNDAFMKVFTHIDRYDAARPFTSWFRRILVNTALDHYRSSRRYHEVIELGEELPEGSVSSDALDRLEADDILVMFAKLPESWRVVYNLHEVEGFSHEEIGEMLGIASGTSRSHLARARARLRLLYVAYIDGGRE
jgi:RNA polymerase sigma factor (sigma-70 family)